MSKKFIVTIDENGNVVFKAEGFPGSTCMLETEKVLQRVKELGLETRTEKIEYTSEYYQQQQRVKQR